MKRKATWCSLKRLGEERRLWTCRAGIWLPTSTCVALGRGYLLSEPQLSHLSNGDPLLHQLFFEHCVLGLVLAVEATAVN